MVIYKITNLINGKIYIGKQVRNNPNYYGSGLIIKQSIQKYGKENFSKDIICECESLDELNEKEIYWIEKLNAIEKGYNITKGGDGGDTTTNHPNKYEIIEKRRLANKGKKRSKEFCILISEIAKNVDPNIRKKAGLKGGKTKRKRIKEKGFTDKELAAQNQNREKLIIYNKSKEARERVSKQFKGKTKTFSEDHKKNIGLASKGRKIPGKKIIIDKTTYDSLHEAFRLLSIPLSTIKK